MKVFKMWLEFESGTRTLVDEDLRFSTRQSGSVEKEVTIALERLYVEPCNDFEEYLSEFGYIPYCIPYEFVDLTQSALVYVERHIDNFVTIWREYRVEWNPTQLEYQIVSAIVENQYVDVGYV